ncbi:MAG: hypothetical protein ACR2N9_03865 [Acidimicrobiia bacterium]
MATFFLLLLVVVQLGFLVMSRSMVAASVDGAARRASVVGADVEAEQQRIRVEIERAIPGADVEIVEVAESAEEVSISVRYRWIPPGPDLVPVRLTVSASRTLVVPP